MHSSKFDNRQLLHICCSFYSLQNKRKLVSFAEILTYFSGETTGGREKRNSLVLPEMATMTTHVQEEMEL